MKIIYKSDTIKKPAIFLDRDGVINKDIKGKYITDIKDVHIYQTALIGLKKIRGYHLIIITNQSAINRGMITIERFKDINDFIVKKLNRHGIFINATYFCPHKPDENCKCRKPKTGLIIEAINDFNIDLGSSIMVGDKISDIELGRKVGVKTILVLTGQGKHEIKKNKNLPDFIIKNLTYLKKIISLFALFIFFSIGVYSTEDPFLKYIFTKKSTSTFIKEIFEYDIYWGFIEVGKATIEFGEVYESTSGVMAYRILAKANSNQFIDSFFKVRDLNTSYLAVDYSKSYGYYKEIKEGKYEFTEYTIYDYKSKSFYGISIKKNKNKEHKGELNENVFDVLSSLIIVMKSTDIDIPKKTINIVTKTHKKIDVINHGIEKIKTPFGKVIAYKLEPMVGEEGIFVAKKGRSMYVYISKDERIPVLLDAEVFIGSVKVILKKHTAQKIN